jgi:hypothetical protein
MPVRAYLRGGDAIVRPAQFGDSAVVPAAILKFIK